MLRQILLIFLWALPSLPLSINKTEHVVKWSGYTNQAALERHLKMLAEEAPDIATTFSLGQSEQVSICKIQSMDKIELIFRAGSYSG